jgi:hypothetical protein
MFLCRVTNNPIHESCRGTEVDNLGKRACASCLEDEKQFKSIAHKDATNRTLFVTGSSTDYDEVCCNKKCPFPTVLLS